MHWYVSLLTHAYRSKIEKEFAENPLIKNLGITIYGSVHEMRQKELSERKVSVYFARHRHILPYIMIYIAMQLLIGVFPVLMIIHGIAQRSSSYMKLKSDFIP